MMIHLPAEMLMQSNGREQRVLHGEVSFSLSALGAEIPMQIKLDYTAGTFPRDIKLCRRVIGRVCWLINALSTESVKSLCHHDFLYGHWNVSVQIHFSVTLFQDS